MRLSGGARAAALRTVEVLVCGRQLGKLGNAYRVENTEGSEELEKKKFYMSKHPNVNVISYYN